MNSVEEAHGRGGEKLFLVVILVVFVAAALWLISQAGGGAAKYLPAMSSYSAFPDGAKALYDLCQRSGFSVRRFAGSEYDYPPGGCVVILDAPDVSVSSLMGGVLDEKALRLWIERGGRLVLLSDPMREVGKRLFEELNPKDDGQKSDDALGNLLENKPAASMTRAQADVYAKPAPGGSAGSQTALWRLYQPGTRYALDKPRPLFFGGVNEIECATPQWVTELSARVLLATADSGQPLICYAKAGQGELFWVTCPEIASNLWIRRADNHRLLLALIERAAQGGAVNFDEHVHGYAKAQRRMKELLLGTNGGRLLLAALLCSVLWFLGTAIGAARVQPAPVPPRRHAAEMVLAQADLYQRAQLRGAMARSLVDGLKRALLAAHHLPRLPSDVELLSWLGEPGSQRRQVGALLAVYLASGAAPRTGRELLRLAQACDRLRPA